MDLLVLKSGTSYVRILDDGYELVNMNKASVYPINQKTIVLEYFQSLQKELELLEIKKLILTEEDYV